MTFRLLIEDAIVGCAILLLLRLYAEGLRRRWTTPLYRERAEERLRMLRRCSILYVVVLMATGMLHQAGTLQGLLAFCIFALVLIIGIMGWLWINRTWRS